MNTVFKDRSDYVGEEILTLDAVGTEAQLTIPSGAKFARIWFNSVGNTGANVVAMYYGTNAANLIKFTDSGGFIEILGQTDMEQFRAKSLSGSAYELQVFYHFSPWR